MLDKIHSGLTDTMAAQGGMTRTLWGWALEAGEKNFAAGKIGSSSWLNSLVMSKVQAKFGGRIKVIITGSAPISKDLLCWFQTVMNCPARQGYGATETMGVSCVGEFDDPEVATVGPPALGTCIRLADWEEGGYKVADEKDPSVGRRWIIRKEQNGF